MDVRFQAPFTLLCCGPTSCGKTRWTQRLLSSGESLINGFPERIVWLYGEYQPAYTEILKTLPQIEFIKGIPEDICEMFQPQTRNLCVIDDLMQESSGNKDIGNLFTKSSHHRNLSVIFIMQNLFYQGKESRTISLNAHYIVLFKNIRDRTQIISLSKQMFPGNVKYMQEAYEDSTKKAYGYLLVDLKPSTLDKMRLRSDIFLEDHTVVYTPKIKLR